MDEKVLLPTVEVSLGVSGLDETLTPLGFFIVFIISSRVFSVRSACSLCWKFWIVCRCVPSDDWLTVFLWTATSSLWSKWTAGRTVSSWRGSLPVIPATYLPSSEDDCKDTTDPLPSESCGRTGCSLFISTSLCSERFLQLKPNSLE